MARYGWTIGYIQGKDFPKDYITLPQLIELYEVIGKYPSIEIVLAGLLGTNKDKHQEIKKNWQYLLGVRGR